MGERGHQNSEYIGITKTKLSRRPTMHVQSGTMKNHLKEKPNTKTTRKIFDNNVEIIHYNNNPHILRIAEANMNMTCSTYFTAGYKTRLIMDQGETESAPGEVLKKRMKTIDGLGQESKGQMFYDPEFGFTQCELRNQEINNNISKFDVNNSNKNDVYNNDSSNNNNNNNIINQCFVNSSDEIDVRNKVGSSNDNNNNHSKFDDGHEEEESKKCKVNVNEIGTAGGADDEEKVTNNSNVGRVDDEGEKINGNDGGDNGGADDEENKFNNNNNVGGNVDEDVMKKIDNDRVGAMKDDVGRLDEDEMLGW
ncbi:hypothetical protein HELRODRAFT_182119 [Helobdella robusta]|uniref:Uncharacterized protein n=1 Tax=Helobdella robusta TaxID=6412 RepID=T1FHS3_HELRO|nr:hypothetical protein HELRODRAFT_182119 [Helobdella robusta]ESN91260.1 hypothetical protein HELRODRAFT_182119 [Helobdella robusta]